MKYKITLLALLLSFIAFSQKSKIRTDDQYSFEAEYGLSLGSSPRIMDMEHWGISFRYMMDRNWGLKFDFAKDRFSEDVESVTVAGNYTRISIQAVNNLGRTLNSMTMNGERLGLLGHAGLGYSSLTSDQYTGTDNIMHLIIGLTPQYKISNSFAVYVDASYIMNYSQHLGFNGLYPNGVGPKTFTGSLVNASLGISYYFGESKSRSDWNSYGKDKDGNRNYD